MSGNAQVNENNEEFYEVDFDTNVTLLYESISNSNWDVSLHALKSNPLEAKTWVVRRQEGTNELMWRFLPLHSACARQPPESVISALLRAFPEAALEKDDQGMFPLHYACGNQASTEVVRTLLIACPQAATLSDPEGMLPIHYMAQWGPSSLSAVDALLFANREVANARDNQGNTPLDLAEDGHYPERTSMMAVLKQYGNNNISSRNSVSGNPVPSPTNTRPATSSTIPKSVYASPSPPLPPSSVSPSPLTFGHSGATPNHSSPSHHSMIMNLPPPIPNHHANNISSNYDNMSLVSYHDGKISASKSVIKLNAEIAKLRAELTFVEADMEEKIMSQREAFEEKFNHAQGEVQKSQDEGQRIQTDTKTKVLYTQGLENKTAHAEERIKEEGNTRQRLEHELQDATIEHRKYVSKVDTLKLQARSAKSSLVQMTTEQENMIKSYASMEEDMKAATNSRRQKLQAMLEDELKFSVESIETKRVFGENGPTVKACLESQKTMMRNCDAVLAECDLNRA